jgi:hypothetical protein
MSENLVGLLELSERGSQRLSAASAPVMALLSMQNRERRRYGRLSAIELK